MNIYIYDKTKPIPENETCYIIAKNGMFLQKKLDLVCSLTPVDQISFLDPIPTYAKMEIPNIPIKMFGSILSFFKSVYNLYKSEAIVLIYLNKKTKKYKVVVPEQEVNPASLSYTPTTSESDYIMIGSIHSHGSMTAFHSGIDVNDEVNFDGIHFTIGKVTSEFFDVCGSIAINGMRIEVDPCEYINGIEKREYTNYSPNLFRPKFEVDSKGKKIYSNSAKTNIGFAFSGSQSDLTFNKIWLNKVTRPQPKVYPRSSYIGARYEFVDGKYVKVEDKRDPLTFNESTLDFQSIYNYLRKDEDKDDNCPCSKCIHRDKKIKMQEQERLEINEFDPFQDIYPI